MKINPITLAPNISRAYEIAIAGEHTISIIPSVSDSMTQPEIKAMEENCQTLRDFYKAGNSIVADMVVEMHQLSPEDILHSLTGKGEHLTDIQQRVRTAKEMNIETKLELTGSVKTLFKASIEKLNLSIRQCHSLLNVSVTIANLSGSDIVRPEHIAEAIQYQSFDR